MRLEPFLPLERRDAMRSQNVPLPPDPAAVMDGLDGILIAANLIEMKSVKDPDTDQMVEVAAQDEQHDPVASPGAFKKKLIANICALPVAVGDQRSEKGSYHNLLTATVSLPFDHANTTDPVEQEIYRQLIDMVKSHCTTGSTATAQQAVVDLGGDKVLLKTTRKKNSKIIGAAGPVDGVWISNSHDPYGDRMDVVKAKVGAWAGGFASNVAPTINLHTADADMAAAALVELDAAKAESDLAVGKIRNELMARATPPAVSAPATGELASATK